MSKQAKTRAEQQFAATQKKDKEFLKDKELARLKNDEHVARLRALRLAKEAADKEAADKAEAEKAAAKKKTTKKKK
jgi:colicin import membrane protein